MLATTKKRRQINAFQQVSIPSPKKLFERFKSVGINPSYYQSLDEQQSGDVLNRAGSKVEAMTLMMQREQMLAEESLKNQESSSAK